MKKKLLVFLLILSFVMTACVESDSKKGCIPQVTDEIQSGSGNSQEKTSSDVSEETNEPTDETSEQEEPQIPVESTEPEIIEPPLNLIFLFPQTN
jgi:thioredoxin-related protein